MAFLIHSNTLLVSVSERFPCSITSLTCTQIKSTLLRLGGWLKFLTKQSLADLKERGKFLTFLF